MATSGRPRARRALPSEARAVGALARLAKERALQTLLRGALGGAVLRRLFRDALPSREARELPEEVWASLASGMAMQSELIGLSVAQALHDRLAWDREPSAPENWDRLGRERPLEALWMAALSEDKAVRKAFSRRAAEWLGAFRTSPACRPPSWEFVEGVLDVHARALRDAQDLAKTTEDLERRLVAERERSDDLRDELKRLRRESSDLRAEKAQLEKKAAGDEPRAWTRAAEAGRVEELERRWRKAEKENEHLRRTLEKTREASSPLDDTAPEEPRRSPPPTEAVAPSAPPLSEDPNPRRRVLRQMLRKLFKKGKIGASHTHEDNVYRGVPDHEKGFAKEWIALLYREGFLMPKPTSTDPHVSLHPERIPEVRAIIAGEIENPRLQRYLAEAE